ncbi:MAG TPA: transglycosylase domain-containing protein [Verrucomicrobiales bacterium]|nr:transglycosylase domain-containing protein [Verrucomicrobiales bacterium]
MASSSPSRPLHLRWFFPRLRRRIAGWRWYWRWLFRGTAGGILLGVVTVLILNVIYSTIASRYDLSDLGRMPERSIVYDGEGREIGRLHGENRIVIKLSEVPPFFIQALLAREDNDFYNHSGIHWKGVARAVYRRVKDGVKQGASTITMQLANNSFGLGKDPSFHRKLVEIALTRRIEATLKKDQILELYVNRIFFGTGIYGVERAAQAYFGKKAHDMTEDECAMLVAIIRGPNKFSPFRNYNDAVSGRNMVLNNMVRFERLTGDEAGRIMKVKTKVLRPPSPPQETWEMDAVRRALQRVLDAEDIEEGGLKVYTTLDPKLQKAAIQVLEKEMQRIERQPGYEHPTLRQFENRRQTEPGATPDYLQGAIVVLDNATGAVLSIVGGRDVEHSSYNRAMLSRRQAGSTFKPFVYAAAIEGGLLPGTLISDNEIVPGEIRSATDPDFSPFNSDKTFTGLRRADWGLAKSRNTMAVRVGEFAGMDAVHDVAERAGFGVIESRSAQLYLGNTGITLEALTSGYSTFPNAGVRCRPFLIDRIEDNTGRLVFRSGVMDPEVLRPGAAWLTTKMLEKVCAPGGTAEEVAKAGLIPPVAGKTGTTDDYRDAWFVGFNPRITCGVWVGLDDPERIISKGYGSKLALPVWIEVMRHAQSLGYRGGSWRTPPLRSVEICAASGCIAGPACNGPRVTETLPEDSLPPGDCPAHTRSTPPLPGAQTGPSRLERLRGVVR